MHLFIPNYQVLIAFGITTVMVLAISIFACQTKIDFTTKTGFLLVALMAFIGFGFMMIFFHNDVCMVFGPYQ
jgi:FtsH-binding integral membrane protein